MKRSPLFWRDNVIKSDGDVSTLGEIIGDVSKLQESTTEDLTDNITITAANKKLLATKCGKVVSLSFSLDDIILTSGNDIIGQIPTEYSSSFTIVQIIHARNRGLWSEAEYYPAVLAISKNGNIYARTGSNYSNIKFLEGDVTFLLDN